MKRTLLRSAAFIRAAKRLIKKNPQLRGTIRQTLTRLEADAFDPQLRTHKLKGSLDRSWSCSAEYDLRIVFDFVKYEGAEAIQLLSMGSHDEVY